MDRVFLGWAGLTPQSPCVAQMLVGPLSENHQMQGSFDKACNSPRHKDRIQAGIKLPEAYWLDYGGTFEQLAKRLQVVVVGKQPGLEHRRLTGADLEGKGLDLRVLKERKGERLAECEVAGGLGDSRTGRQDFRGLKRWVGRRDLPAQRARPRQIRISAGATHELRQQQDR